MATQTRLIVTGGALAAIVGMLLMAALAAGEASADGTGSPVSCLDASNPSSVPQSPATTVDGNEPPGSYSPGANNRVVYVCLSDEDGHSGPLTDGLYDANFQSVQSDGCYSVSGVGVLGQAVSVSDVDDCGLDHFDVGIQVGRAVRIVKVTEGSGPTVNFTGTISAHSPGSWSVTGASSTTLNGVSTGSHTVIEDAPTSGWVFGGYRVLQGLQTSCPTTGYGGARSDGAFIPSDTTDYTVCIRNTFTDTRTVRIIKVTSGGGLPQTFSGTISGHSPGNWFVQGGSFSDITGVSTGSHVVTENVPPSGWSFVGYKVLTGLQTTCGADSGYSGARENGAFVQAGTGDVTVCIRNVFTPGRTVRIIKVTEGGGLPQLFDGTISDHTFPFWTVQGGPAPLGGQATDISGVSTGSHVVTEGTPPPGWVFDGYYLLSGLHSNCLGAGVYSGTRTAGVFIPADGNNYTVCIRNLYQPGRTVRIIKVTSGGGLPQNFSGIISDHAPGTWTAAGGVSPAGGTPVDINGVSFSSHSVIESGPPTGWTFDGYAVLSGLQSSCSGVTSYSGNRASGAFIPADSNNYTVCIRNTYSVSRTVRIIKVTSGGGLPQNFSGTISNHPSGTWTVAGGFAPNGGTPTDISAVSGTSHVIVENAPPTGWEFGGYYVLSGLQANCSLAGAYGGARTTGVTIPADANSYTVCIRNTLVVAATPTPTATVPPPAPTATPTPTQRPPSTVAPGPPSTGVGAGGDGGPGSIPLWVLGGLIMLASMTLAVAAGARRAHAAAGAASGPTIYRRPPAGPPEAIAPAPAPQPGETASFDGEAVDVSGTVEAAGHAAAAHAPAPAERASRSGRVLVAVAGACAIATTVVIALLRRDGRQDN